MKRYALFFMIIALPSIARDHNHDHHKIKVSQQRKEITLEEREFIVNVLSENDKLFNALLSEDKLKIEQKAKDLFVLIEKNKSPTFKDLKLKSLKLKEMKSSYKHEDNLEPYEEFLEPLLRVVKNYDVGSNFKVFSCPMVKKSWLQDVRVNNGVKNVFATYMLECGSQDTRF